MISRHFHDESLSIGPILMKAEHNPYGWISDHPRMEDAMISRREAIAHREMQAGEPAKGRAWHIAVVAAVALVLIGVGLMLGGCAPAGFLLECARRGAGCN